jgi:uncharacterized membrane protein
VYEPPFAELSRGIEVRPASVVNFERVVLLTLALGAANAVLTWDALVAGFAARGLGPSFVVGAHVAGGALILALLWMMSRRRSDVARWIYVALTVAGILVTLFAITPNDSGAPILLVIEVLQMLLSLISLWLLFRPDAQGWFAATDG